MDIRTLRYFVEVVRQQSFTRAAEKLFVTQPTISKMLKNLEDELNCILLIRCFSLILVASYLSAGWLYWLSFGNWKLSLAISISLKPAFCGWESRRWLGC